MRHDPAAGAIVIMLRSLKMYGMAQAVTDLIEQGAPAFEAAIPMLSQLLKAELTAPERRDLLEILEDRHGRASTIVTSQLPVEHWHEAIGDPTLADAILDRLVHNAHRLKLTGESMRKAAARNSSLDPVAQA